MLGMLKIGAAVGVAYYAGGRIGGAAIESLKPDMSAEGKVAVAWGARAATFFLIAAVLR